MVPSTQFWTLPRPVLDMALSAVFCVSKGVSTRDRRPVDACVPHDPTHAVPKLQFTKPRCFASLSIPRAAQPAHREGKGDRPRATQPTCSATANGSTAWARPTPSASWPCSMTEASARERSARSALRPRSAPATLPQRARTAWSARWVGRPPAACVRGARSRRGFRASNMAAGFAAGRRRSRRRSLCSTSVRRSPRKRRFAHAHADSGYLKS